MTTFTDQEQSIEDQAAFWLVRLGALDCTPEDRFAFEAWKQQDPAHERMFSRLQRGNALVDRHMTDSRIVAMLEEARAERHAGERSVITLADGSIVSSNTNSLVEVSFSASERLVKLLRGQAYFEVAEDVYRPFVVQAGDQRVVALGTAFDVRFDREDRVEITLVEGRVEVNDVSRARGTFPRKGGQAPVDPIALTPGHRLIARAASASEVVVTDTVEETSWRSGQLLFRERPLASAVEEINRYSLQKLVLADDPRVRALAVSGVFNSGGRASSFVNALQELHPLHAQRTGRDEITLVWRE